MKRIKIIVEGQTEEQFVKRVLAPSFYNADIYFVPLILYGVSKSYGYKKVKNELNKHLYDEKAIITTMIDYYGLPKDFPGYARIPSGTSYKKVEYLESEFLKDIGKDNFIPYLQLHEFEALLFSSIEGFRDNLILRDDQLRKFQDIISATSPEKINDGKETHPAKRIESIYPGYGKLSDGILIAETLGLNIMREKCPHFSEWITKLENIL